METIRTSSYRNTSNCTFEDITSSPLPGLEKSQEVYERIVRATPTLSNDSLGQSMLEDTMRSEATIIDHIENKNNSPKQDDPFFATVTSCHSLDSISSPELEEEKESEIKNAHAFYTKLDSLYPDGFCLFLSNNHIEDNFESLTPKLTQKLFQIHPPSAKLEDAVRNYQIQENAYCLSGHFDEMKEKYPLGYQKYLDKNKREGEAPLETLKRIIEDFAKNSEDLNWTKDKIKRDLSGYQKEAEQKELEYFNSLTKSEKKDYCRKTFQAALSEIKNKFYYAYMLFLKNYSSNKEKSVEEIEEELLENYIGYDKYYLVRLENSVRSKHNSYCKEITSKHLRRIIQKYPAGFKRYCLDNLGQPINEEDALSTLTMKFSSPNPRFNTAINEFEQTIQSLQDAEQRIFEPHQTFLFHESFLRIIDPNITRENKTSQLSKNTDQMNLKRLLKAAAAEES